MDQKPSESLTKRSFTARNVLIGAGVIALVAAGGCGAFALAQPRPTPQVAAQAEPTPTPPPTPTEEPNAAPIAYYVVAAVNGLTLEFDASGSSDSDGTVDSYAWDFGDSGAGSGPAVAHTFEANGSYTVTLTVTDNDGVSNAFQAVIDAVGPPASGYTYGSYPPGATMPNIPGTDQPDTSACASSTGTADGNGNPVCA